MAASRVAPFLLAASAIVPGASAHDAALPATPGSLVALSVTVEGAPAWLLPARDGTRRFYLEARRGCRYALTLENRSGERVAAVLTVDGLNVISGERDTGRGRMYVLDPWQRTTVQGWRTSLEEVRRFRFVDEQASYAARSGKANRKMGWIELAVYRERRPIVQSLPEAPPSGEPRDASAPAAGRADRDAGRPAEKAAPGPAPAQAYPGTGWGERARDRAFLVQFDPECEPCERATLRYEYRPALVALGVLPPMPAWRDRLHERDRAEPGFAPPPLW
ncbi:MAG: hypothetical protein ACM3PV_03155 [Betaproteobacteria bacterium]